MPITPARLTPQPKMILPQRNTTRQSPNRIRICPQNTQINAEKKKNLRLRFCVILRVLRVLRAWAFSLIPCVPQKNPRKHA
jgi:hypothetical protein